MTAATARAEATPWHPWREAARAALLLGAREVRTSLRTPAYLIPNLLVPIFFYFIMVGSLESFAGQSGVDNWRAFEIFGGTFTLSDSSISSPGMRMPTM